jgi:hypothetical protein
MDVDIGPVNQLPAHFTVQNIPFGSVSAGCNVKTLFRLNAFGNLLIGSL